MGFGTKGLPVIPFYVSASPLSFWCCPGCLPTGGFSKIQLCAMTVTSAYSRILSLEKEAVLRHQRRVAMAGLPSLQPLFRYPHATWTMHFQRRTTNSLLFRSILSRAFTISAFLPSKQPGTVSNSKNQAYSLTDANFWTSRSAWRRAGVNTLRCLLGCTVGDFSTMWYLQRHCPDLGLGTIMGLSSKVHFLPCHRPQTRTPDCYSPLS
jgi:hypothetical protein